MPDPPPTDDPTRANSPDSPGGTPGVSDRVSPGAPPPASNQRKDEPIPPGPDVTDAAGTVASAHPQSPHAIPPAPDAGAASPGAPDAGAASPGAADAGAASPGAADAGAASPGAPGSPGMTPAQSRPTVDLDSGRGGAGSPVSDTGGFASRVPGQQETRESPLDPIAELDAARTAPGASPQSVSPGTPAPGNAHGVSVPATESAPGTSQESSIVAGVRSSPGDVPAAADGEADTRG